MQAEELSYVIVTPYSMRKSRTGGIISRLISRTGLDLVAARMFAPSDELVRRYAETIVTETDPRHRATQELIRDYVLKNFTGERERPAAARSHAGFSRAGCGRENASRGRPHRARADERRNHSRHFRRLHHGRIGKVTYFEPGVLAAFEHEAVEADLKLWAEFSDSDGGILDRRDHLSADAKRSRKRSS